MEQTGTLQISGEDSRIDGTLLIRNGNNPPARATAYLEASGFVTGDPITVTGTDDSWQGEYAINMQTAYRPAFETKRIAFASAEKAIAMQPERNSASGVNLVWVAIISFTVGFLIGNRIRGR